MLGIRLVAPLEEDWRETLDGVAASRGWTTSRDARKLGRLVADLSARYNDPGRASATMRTAGAARLGFSFARDVPKAAGAVRELLATGMLPFREGVLRILDLGAGLGATTWGVVRALEASGARGTVEATWVDEDEAALEVGRQVVAAREARGDARVRLRVKTSVRRADGALDGAPRCDLVMAGQLLSELHVGLDDEERGRRQAELVADWLARRTEPDGSLVVIEPALRDRTRTLHRVRDVLAAQPGAGVFAPCLHAAPCPALARQGDWCHEDLAVDLPTWLVPVARAAGLRREGLTFSYLVLRRDGARLADKIAQEGEGAKVRVVSGALPSKGKLEALVCGVLNAQGELGGARAVRLDRDASRTNAPWDELARGDLLCLEPAPELDRRGASCLLRIGRGVGVRIATKSR